jgi:hypothetical protein
VTAALSVLAILLAVLVVACAVMLARVERVLARVEKLLTLNERHGALTDDKVQEIKDNALTAAKDVVGALKSATKEIKAEVPPKVVEQIARAGPDSHGDSGIVRTAK